MGFEFVVFGLKPSALLALGEFEFAPQLLHFSGDFLDPFLPLFDGGLAIENDIRFAGRPEIGLQAVVVDLADGIEAMVMAAGATDRQTQERRSHQVRALGEHLVPAERDGLVAGVPPYRA